MRMPRKRAVGQQGSWFATVDGEALPCVHKRFLSGLDYHDPVEGEPLPEGYVKAIGKGTVILTKSRKIEDGKFERSGYVAIYRIDDFDSSDGQVRFRLVERIANLI